MKEYGDYVLTDIENKPEFTFLSWQIGVFADIVTCFYTYVEVVEAERCIIHYFLCDLY